MELKFMAYDGKQMHYNVSIVNGEAIKYGHHGTSWTDNSKAGTPYQFTGLQDKNGKEIYEGHIIRSTSEIIKLMTNQPTGRYSIKDYEVRWEADKARWGRFANNKFELLSGFDKKSLETWYEIIGHITDNTEGEG